MSCNQGRTKDVVIDPVNDSDENEDVPSLPTQDHMDMPESQDNALLGPFNGDPLGTNGSLQFKKSYNSNPLEVSVNPPLEDEPLPIEPVSLNPFSIGMSSIHHNSPLHSRSSESHNFNVSVSDSLPPLVMELDSPEHSFGEPETDDEKDCDNGVSLFKDVPEIPHPAPTKNIIPAKTPEVSTEAKPSKVGKSAGEKSNRGKRNSSHSNASSKRETHVKDAIVLPIKYELNESLKVRERTPDRAALLSDTNQSRNYSQRISMHSTSPKRKSIARGSKSKAPRLEQKPRPSASIFNKNSMPPESSDSSDNEIEILDNSNKDESIEVLYDKKESKPQETQSSQDFRLVFTGTSQSQSEACSFLGSSKEPESSKQDKFDSFLQGSGANDSQSESFFEKDCDQSQSLLEKDMSQSQNLLEKDSQSQSLLSMASSDNLMCIDSLSSSPAESPAVIQSTIPASQIEALCKPALHHSQPNIDPLIEFPILDKPQKSCSTSNSSTSTKCSNNELEKSHSDASQPSQEQESSAHVESLNSNHTSSICMPHFETPLDEAVVEERSESVFQKATEAAKKKLEQENISTKGKPPEIDKPLESGHDSISDFNSSAQDSDAERSSDFLTLLSSFSHNISSTKPSPAPGNSAIFFPPRNDSVLATSQDSNVLAEDSDDESTSNKATKSSLSCPLDKVKTIQKTSTPNDGACISLNVSSGGSCIPKDEALDSKVSEVSHVSPGHKEDSETETIPLSNEIKSISDLISSNFTSTKRKVEITEWRNSAGEIYYSLGDTIIQDPKIDGLLIAQNSSSSSSGRGRISDISTISRATTASSIYFGDRSGSSEGSIEMFNRLESTRQSLGSVAYISPPRDVHTDNSTSSNMTSTDAEIEVTYSKLQKPQIFLKPLMKDQQEKNKAELTSDAVPEKELVSVECQTDSLPPPQVEAITPVRRAKVRGRPRGRSRRGITKSFPTLLERSEIENSPCKLSVENSPNKAETDVSSMSVEESKSPSKEKDLLQESPVTVKMPEAEPSQTHLDDYLSKLHPEMVQRLKTCQLPLSEDDEAVFKLQNQNSYTQDDEKLKQIILKKIREVDLKPGLLVFARYLDNTFYSAILVKESSVRDRWDVIYNLDKRHYTVLEVNILPTNFLPRGCFCYVRHHTGDFCDPGTVRGHIFENDMVLHLIQTHRGTLVKVPHSFLQLKSSVAEEMLQTRRSFKCLVASPGRDISLDNVIPKERPRRATLTAATSKAQPSTKFQSVNSPKRTLPKPRKADVNLDSSSGTEAYLKGGSKSSAKKSKVQSVVSMPGSSTSESDSVSSLKVLRKMSTVAKTSKSLGTPSKSKVPMPDLETPTKVGDNAPSSPSKGSPSHLLSVEHNLKNPVVELVHLEEVAASPKSTPKKRGRKQTSGKTPKKFLKLVTEDDNDLAEHDPSLGPLPPEGSKIFQGYYVLITATNVTKHISEDPLPPLDKGHLIEQITRGGGTVLESIDEAFQILTEHCNRKSVNLASKSESPRKAEGTLRQLQILNASESPSKVICVSSTFSRTEKFIKCLVLGIPIVNSLWVINSCFENACMNWIMYLLPAGLSLITGESMEQSFGDKNKHLSKSLGKVVDIFKGEKVFLASSDMPKFAELWMTLLTCAQAQVFSSTPKSSLSRLIDRRTSVVIADSTIPEAELARATTMNVPVVSTEWFIQSLIARIKLNYDMHPSFKHDYKKVDLQDVR